MRIVLAGSPAFVVPTFRQVIAAHEVVAIITQPPARAGRGLKLVPTPVAELGAAHGIPVYAPANIADVAAALTALSCDVLLTFAYGQLLPAALLTWPRVLPLNIHASLLPKYRGAAPVQAAVLNGDAKIGISLMVMTAVMDAGPILFQEAAPLPATATGGEALALVAHLAETHIQTWLARVAAHEYTLAPQGPGATYSPKLRARDAVLTPTLTRAAALRRIRAFNPVPGARFQNGTESVKVFAATLTPNPQALAVPCADGLLYATEYQRPGRRRVRLIP